MYHPPVSRQRRNPPKENREFNRRIGEINRRDCSAANKVDIT
jgi:hypothetical protein